MLFVLFVLQYSNVYVATPKLPQLLKNKELQTQCIQYVSLPGEDNYEYSYDFNLCCM